MADSKEKPTGSETPKGKQATAGDDNEDYGYSLFPKREPEGSILQPPKKSSFFSIFGENRKASKSLLQKYKCEQQALSCAKQDPLVKLMLGAMKSIGCPVDFKRHVSCEECEEIVGGGFDPLNNQVVLCQNNIKRKSTCCSVLTHELIHAYDTCRAKTDLKDVEHLACTEIRAANLCHCSYLAAVNAGDASPMNIKKRHQECVKTKALLSVVMARNISPADAAKVIDKVFTRCYNDMEPIGRRVKRGKPKEAERALHEGVHYGYDL